MRVAAVAGLVLAFALPTAASGHAELVAASPGSGIGLAQAPAAVVIKFSEPLNLSLSRILVLAASGLDVGTGSTEGVAGDPDAMRRRLGLLPVGQYSVRWTSVSLLDGHTLRGSYSFAVGTSASDQTTIANSPLDSEGLLGLVGRFAALVALSLWLGAVLLARAAARAGLDATRVNRLRRFAPAVAFIGVAVALISSSIVASGSLAGLAGVVAGQSGQARLVELVASGLGFLVVARWPIASGLLAAVAIGADAVSGHAASSAPPPVGIASFAVHLGAVGVWIFAIAGSLFAARDVRRALATFTPYAVTAAVITAATGVVNAILELADPADLIQTPYGLAILAKVAAFVLMAGFGFTHFVWRRRPLAQGRDLRLPLRSEASAALVALIVATLLVGFPNPPREAGAAERATGRDEVLAQLGTRPALSLAAASGPFVVGLTVLPPAIGPVQIHVNVLGVEAGDALRNARFTATLDGVLASAESLAACGLGCFAGSSRFDRRGTWRLAVEIDSNRGAILMSDTVAIPTPDGSAELARALGAVERLQSAKLDESLSGRVGGVTYRTVYRFQAPDRMEYTLNGSTTIIIGEREFSRTANGGWSEQPFPAPGFRWPSGYYREFWRGAAAIRLLGTATVDGVPVTEVAFVRPDVPAWFRVWIGTSDGLIRREQMRAEGHIMDHTYSGFDRATAIGPPPSP